MPLLHDTDARHSLPGFPYLYKEILMIVEYRMLVTESLGHNRTALMAALKEHNIKTAIVTYSGAGDSGDVDGVETTPREAIKALEANKVTMRLPKGEFADGQYVYRKEDVAQPIV